MDGDMLRLSLFLRRKALNSKDKVPLRLSDVLEQFSSGRGRNEEVMEHFVGLFLRVRMRAGKSSLHSSST
jgi:hypothetical protein